MLAGFDDVEFFKHRRDCLEVELCIGFFNQLIAAFRGWSVAPNDSRKAISFGDDTEIPDDAMQRVSDLADGLSFDVAWQTGDVALVDNFLVMHGRRPFSGKRCVLVSLVSDDGSRLAA